MSFASQQKRVLAKVSVKVNTVSTNGSSIVKSSATPKKPAPKRPCNTCRRSKPGSK